MEIYENDISWFFWENPTPYQIIQKCIKGEENRKVSLEKNLFPSIYAYSSFFWFVDIIKSKKWGYKEATDWLTQLKYNNEAFKKYLSDVYFNDFHKNETGKRYSAYMVLSDLMESMAVRDENGYWIDTDDKYEYGTLTGMPTPTSPNLKIVDDVIEEQDKIVETFNLNQNKPSVFEKYKPYIIGGLILAGFILLKPYIDISAKAYDIHLTKKKKEL